MSNYNLLTNQKVTQSAPPPVVPVDPWGTVLGVTNPLSQTFQLVITGSAGNVSGTVQIVVSNDGVNWQNYGDPMVAASGYLTAQAQFTGTQPWTWFGAILTAISGTNAVANLIMAA